MTRAGREGAGGWWVSPTLRLLTPKLLISSTGSRTEIKLTDDDGNSTNGDLPSAMMNAAANLAKAVPVYDDAVRPLAVETGKALGTVGQLVNAALMPVRGLVWSAEQIEDWIATRVSEKVADIPPDEIITPKPSIAGPTIEALKYRGHEAEISELFANLLANAMSKRNAETVHPVFVEAIKQITPFEASLFAAISAGGSIPVANIRIELVIDGNRGGANLHSYVNDSLRAASDPDSSVNDSEWAAALENLSRLNLIELNMEGHLTAAKHQLFYNGMETHSLVTSLRSANLPPDQKIIVKKGYISLTALGQRFSSVALSPPKHPPQQTARSPE